RDDGRDLWLARERGAGALQRGGEFGWRIGTEGGVADLAPRARRLAIVVPVPAGLGQHRLGRGQFADPVEHAGVAKHARAAERQAEHRAEMVFELRSLRALDAPVPG